MPDPEDPAEAAARLERALERIAAGASRIARGPDPLAQPGAPEPAEQATTRAVATRLDALIARLRDALDTGPVALPEPNATDTPRAPAGEA